MPADAVVPVTVSSPDVLVADPAGESPDRLTWLFPLCIGLGAGVLAWWLTTPALLVALDWDNAFHLWQIDRLLTRGPVQCGFGGSLWTCGYTAHLALQPLYGIGAAVAKAAGGETLDGLRAINAVAIAIAAASVTRGLRQLGVRVSTSLLVVLAWLGSADVLFLIRTVEDDCVSLAWMGLLLVVCLPPSGYWSLARAFAGGCVLACGMLTNYPVIVWAPVIVGSVLLHPSSIDDDKTANRLLYVGAAVVGFVTVLTVWGVWVTTYDPMFSTWSGYAYALLSSPNSGLSDTAGQVDQLLRYVSRYPLDTLLPATWYPGTPLEGSAVLSRVVALTIGALLMMGIVMPLRKGIQHVTAVGRMVSVACLVILVCTVPAAWKGDRGHYERMDHVPLGLALLVAAGLTRAASQSRRYVAGTLAAVIVAVPVINAVTIVRATRAQSWLARFEAMRQQAPRGTTFVFAESEFRPADYDKLMSLAVRLPNHVVLSPDGDIRQWPFTPVNHVLVDDYLAHAPSFPYLSEAAAAMLVGSRAAPVRR